MSDFERPPLGIMPRNVWLHLRLQELYSAIQRQLCQIKKVDYSLISEWQLEASMLLTQILTERK